MECEIVLLKSTYAINIYHSSVNDLFFHLPPRENKIQILKCFMSKFLLAINSSFRQDTNVQWPSGQVRSM